MLPLPLIAIHTVINENFCPSLLDNPAMNVHKEILSNPVLG
jgi:hypothetical protein